MSKLREAGRSALALSSNNEALNKIAELPSTKNLKNNKTI